MLVYPGLVLFSENFSFSKQGLGYLISYGFQVFNFTLVLLSVLLTCVLATLMYVFVEAFEKILIGKEKADSKQCYSQLLSLPLSHIFVSFVMFPSATVTVWKQSFTRTVTTLSFRSIT